MMNRTSILGGFLFGLLAFGLVIMIGEVREANAQQAELTRLLHEAATASEPGTLDHVEVTCNGTAQDLTASFSGGRVLSYSCLVDSGAAASVYFGDSGVTTTDYGDVRAASERHGGDVRGEYCVTDGTSVELHCRASLRRF